ncbi:unnamed protein product [Symbiodinium microadriaticum]|nr:unnamed protein product [Symbiodinium microadriaticum]CAE7947446.1 unnamed protein product [Symbiodinium sp. KB8]
MGAAPMVAPGIERTMRNARAEPGCKGAPCCPAAADEPPGVWAVERLQSSDEAPSEGIADLDEVAAAAIISADLHIDLQASEQKIDSTSFATAAEHDRTDSLRYTSQRSTGSMGCQPSVHESVTSNQNTTPSESMAHHHTDSLRYDRGPSQRSAGSMGHRSSVRETMTSNQTTPSESMGSLVTMTKTDRFTSQRYSLVDEEIVRGISLRRSLVCLGRVWRYKAATWKPEHRAALYQLSQSVLGFDVFVSHTWRSPGWWKTLSLSFQCGWRNALCLWLAVEVTVFALCLADVLPMPLVYEANVMGFTQDCPMGIWVFSSGWLAILLGLLGTPYLPDCCSPSDVGFIDVASIHQQDYELIERGVYGIAGFLRVSSELRILWSSPYLSRLWCIFELAAYKKVNPCGMITFRPLYVERVLAIMLLSGASFGLCFVLVRSGSGGASMAYVGYALFVIPYTIAAVLLRRNFREKHMLRQELETFDLSNVSCAKEFDRKFILAAIEKWYGSQEAFSEFVQTELRQQLEPLLATSRFPTPYLLLVFAALITASLEFLLALWKGGAPPACLVSFAVGILVGVDIFLVGALIVFFANICDRLAPQRFGRFDHLQTALAMLLLTVVFGIGSSMGTVAYSSSLEHGFLFALACLLLGCFIWWIDGAANSCACCSQPSPEHEVAPSHQTACSPIQEVSEQP